MSSFLDLALGEEIAPRIDPAASADESKGSFRIGQTFKDTFNVFSKNFIRNYIYILIVAVPVGFLMFVGVGLIGQKFFTNNSQPNPAIGFVPLLIIMSGVFIMQIGIIKSATDVFNEIPTSLGTMFSSTVKKALPILAGGILVTAMIMIGWILLMIPGLMIMTALLIFSVILISEDKSVLDSLQRSRMLTKGYRWPIFGAMILLLIILQAFNMVLMVFSFLGPWARIAIPFISIFITLSLWPCFVSSVYINLRRAKEGVDVSDIAKTFE